MSKEYLRGDEQLIKDILKEYRGKTRYISSFESLERNMVTISKCPVVELPSVPHDKRPTDDEEFEKISLQGLVCITNPFFQKCVYKLGLTYIYINTDTEERNFLEGILYTKLPTVSVRGVKSDKPLILPFVINVKDKGYIPTIVLKNKIAKMSIRTVYGTLRHHSKTVSPLHHSQYLENVEVGKMWVETTLDKGTDEAKARIKEDLKSIPKEQHADYYCSLSEVITQLQTVMNILGWIHVNDYFSVEVTSPAHDKVIRTHKGNPALMPSGPKVKMIQKKIIDTMRETVSNEGEGSPRAPHHRRGTWITLRADRYRNHPLYQVENGIYRKESWVGPREFISEGNVYKVMD